MTKVVDAPAPEAPEAAGTDVAEGDKPKGAPRTIKFYDPRVYGDTKGAWRSFHAQEVKACSKCGSMDFDLDWKHKEKTCRKCGEIFPLPRRSA